MDRLFDPAELGVPRRVTPTSSPYERLAGSDGEAAVRVRALLEVWWSDLPSAARPQVRERLRSPMPAIHLGAFWELYTHASLRRLFGAVIVDVGEDHLERRQPDFSLTDRDGGVCFEATAVAGDDFVRRGERPRAQQFYSLVERSSNRDFLLHLQLISVGPSTPGRRLLTEIERWLNSLDWKSELRKKEAGQPPAERVFRRDGWAFEIGASPWLPHLRGRKDLRLIGSKVEGFGSSGRFRLMDEVSPLRSALRRKAGHRYELDGRPFVVASLCAGALVDDEDIAQALLGPIRHRLGGGGHYVGGGLWLGEDDQPRNRDTSAVLTAINLNPAGVAQVEPTLWTNPWARNPLPSNLLPWRRMEIAPDGHTDQHAAIRAAFQVFELDPAWPQSG